MFRGLAAIALVGLLSFPSLGGAVEFQTFEKGAIQQFQSGYWATKTIEWNEEMLNALISLTGQFQAQPVFPTDEEEDSDIIDWFGEPIGEPPLFMMPGTYIGWMGNPVFFPND